MGDEKQEVENSFFDDDEKLFSDQDEQHHTLFRKIFLLGVVFIILIFFLVYALLGQSLQKIEGGVHSAHLKSSKLVFGKTIVYFENGTLTELLKNFYEVQRNSKKEFSVCLEGNINNNIYFINKVFYPTIIEQTMTHVEFSSCPQRTIVMLHSHPFGDCLASPTDLVTLKKVKRYNPEILMLIMCDDDLFALYI
jgi:hypothetical protein